MTGETAFDMDDLEVIAAVLDIKVGDLFPRREGRSSQDFEHAPAESTATIGHLSVPLPRRVTRTSRRQPNGSTAPGPNRPVSTVPARKRRPQPVQTASELARA